MDAKTGTMMVKPNHLATLRLLEFHTFLSLMFRATDMAAQGNSPVYRSAVPAIQNLIRNLIRQYETFKWAGEDTRLWEWTAYLSWTHLVLTRVETEGFHWEAAFEREARAQLKRGLHSKVKRDRASPSSDGGKTNHLTRTDSHASHWFICPCCATVNEHFPPSCPTQANGPSKIPASTIATTKKLINTVPLLKTELTTHDRQPAG